MRQTAEITCEVCHNPGELFGILTATDNKQERLCFECFDAIVEAEIADWDSYLNQ